jgi:excinuclease ABC subunit A
MDATCSYSFRRRKKIRRQVLLQQGFARICLTNEMVRLDDLLDSLDKNEILLIVDRIVVKEEEEFITVLPMRYKLL